MKQVFEHITKTEDIKFKHSKGMRDIFGKEIHQYHEIFLFISGDATFITEYESLKLKPYTLITIPQKTFHLFDVHGDEADYERYILNFYNINELDTIINKAMSCISVISSPSKMLIDDLLFMDNNEYSESEKKLLIYSKLISILLEIGNTTLHKPNIEKRNSPLVSACLNYINQNIESKITVDTLAKALNYSKSIITHKFSSEMKIPLHRYIILKKLTHAQIDIKKGVPLTEVCYKYGFSDYSCFYRHYKKHFGVSPSVKSSKW